MPLTWIDPAQRLGTPLLAAVKKRTRKNSTFVSTRAPRGQRLVVHMLYLTSRVPSSLSKASGASEGVGEPPTPCHATHPGSPGTVLRHGDGPRVRHEGSSPHQANTWWAPKKRRAVAVDTKPLDPLVITNPVKAPLRGTMTVPRHGGCPRGGGQWGLRGKALWPVYSQPTDDRMTLTTK